MPRSVERALADSLSLEHPDVPWTPPQWLPTAGEIRDGIAALTVPAVDPKHAAWCLAKLMVAFEPGTKLTPEETRLRAAVWIEANADLGDTLWSKATLAAVQSSKWMPKPAEFRALVAVQLADRATKLQRCEQMLRALGEAKTAGAEQPLETRVDRLRATIAAYTKHGRPFDAARVQRELDIEEGRDPGASTAAVKWDTPERPPFVPGTSPTDRRCAELAARGRQPKQEYREVPE